MAYVQVALRDLHVAEAASPSPHAEPSLKLLCREPHNRALPLQSPAHVPIHPDVALVRVSPLLALGVVVLGILPVPLAELLSSLVRVSPVPVSPLLANTRFTLAAAGVEGVLRPHELAFGASLGAAQSRPTMTRAMGSGYSSVTYS